MSFINSVTFESSVNVASLAGFCCGVCIAAVTAFGRGTLVEASMVLISRSDEPNATALDELIINSLETFIRPYLSLFGRHMSNFQRGLDVVLLDILLLVPGDVTAAAVLSTSSLNDVELGAVARDEPVRPGPDPPQEPEDRLEEELEQLDERDDRHAREQAPRTADVRHEPLKLRQAREENTVRWSNFDRRNPKLGVFFHSTQATPCGHLLK